VLLSSYRQSFQQLSVRTLASLPGSYITGRVDKELLLRNEYLAAENRILRAKIKGRLQLSDGEKRTLGEIAHRLGRKALAEMAMAARPDTILRWFRKLGGPQV
jgi:hypothetical protein